MNVYRPDKVTLHPERIRQLCRGEQPAPVQAELILSDACNQDCEFCAFRSEGYSSNALFTIRDESGQTVNHNPHRLMPTAKVHQVIGDCARMGVKALQLTGGGEPTVHPDFDRILGMIRNAGLDVGLVTNGVRLSQPAIDTLVQPGAETWVRVSVDAGTPETYTAIRRCPHHHWSAAWDTIRRLVATRSTAPQSPLVIGVSFVVMAENWQEILKATALARDAKVDYIRFAAVFKSEGAAYFADFYKDASELCREAQLLWSPTFSVINMLPGRVGDLQQGSPESAACGYQHFRTFIGGDQNVYRCCVLAYNPRGLIGSIEKQSFQTVWESQAKREGFATFDARECPPCPFNDKNRAIAGAMDAQRHGNFV